MWVCVGHIKAKHTRSIMRGIHHGTKHIHNISKRCIILSNTLNICLTANDSSKHIRCHNNFFFVQPFTSIGQKGAIVHGCTVGDNTLIGMGAVLLNGAKVGSDCIVGAGALVTGKLEAPDGSMILGSPAKVVRPLTPEEIAGNRASAEGYLETAKRYREGVL